MPSTEYLTNVASVVGTKDKPEQQTKELRGAKGLRRTSMSPFLSALWIWFLVRSGLATSLASVFQFGSWGIFGVLKWNFEGSIGGGGRQRWGQSRRQKRALKRPRRRMDQCQYTKRDTDRDAKPPGLLQDPLTTAPTQQPVIARSVFCGCEERSKAIPQVTRGLLRFARSDTLRPTLQQPCKTAAPS